MTVAPTCLGPGFWDGDSGGHKFGKISVNRILLHWDRMQLLSDAWFIFSCCWIPFYAHEDL